MKTTKEQKKKFNSFYEEKFRKFYFKFIIHPGDIKDRLLDCFDHFEYAYSLSQSDGVPIEVKNEWKRIWDELMSNPVKSDYRELYFSLQNKIHRMHYKTLQKYIIFFVNEYGRITRSHYTDK